LKRDGRPIPGEHRRRVPRPGCPTLSLTIAEPAPDANRPARLSKPARTYAVMMATDAGRRASMRGRCRHRPSGPSGGGVVALDRAAWPGQRRMHSSTIATVGDRRNGGLGGVDLGRFTRTFPPLRRGTPHSGHPLDDDGQGLHPLRGLDRGFSGRPIPITSFQRSDRSGLTKDPDRHGRPVVPAWDSRPFVPWMGGVPD
jgi:hypothetical protein